VDKPTSVAAYLKSVDREQRAALEKLRQAIASAVPEAEEGIAWSMPAFKLRGKALVCYAAFKDHYSFFAMSTAAIDLHRDALGDRVTGKGTIAFGYDERLPVTLVKKIVRTRAAEVEAGRGPVAR
jgi:uncharacterized protein YdhG (YjbR/CyaY superfamily)